MKYRSNEVVEVLQFKDDDKTIKRMMELYKGFGNIYRVKKGQFMVPLFSGMSVINEGEFIVSNGVECPNILDEEKLNVLYSKIE